MIARDLLYFRRMPSPINVECELRAFVTPERYQDLIEKFSRIAMSGGADEQVTYYFEGNGDPDLRIQRHAYGSKIWMKKGKLHDEAREEIEIECKREDFETLENLFVALGYRISIKWFRLRHRFKWDGISVMLDHTRGYGHILELEKLCTANEREGALAELRAKFEELGVPITPKEEFEKAYARYKAGWRELTA